MELTPQLKKGLREAILSAYPTCDKLTMLLEEEMSEKFNVIAQGDDYSMKVFNLIKDFEAKGTLGDFIKIIVRDKPKNEKLKSISKELEELEKPGVSNPFHAGGSVPPDQFIGRTAEINTAFDLIRNRSHLAIYGLNGMGKTSLLKYLASPQAWRERGLNEEHSRSLIIYLNCKAIERFTPTKFWREILQEISKVVPYNSPIGEAIAEIIPKDEIGRLDIRKILAKIGEQNKFLVLLLDGYGAALHPNPEYTETAMLNFLAGFRNLAVHCQEGENLSTIVTSNRPLNQLGPKVLPDGSPWYNHYFFQPLKPFNKGDVTELLGKMPHEWRLNDQQQQEITNLSSSYPMLLQIACYLLFNNFRQTGKIIQPQFRAEFIAATEVKFQNIWESLLDDEQIVLMSIVLLLLKDKLQEDYPFDPRIIDNILSHREKDAISLQNLGIIYSKTTPDKVLYDFASEIMRWWITQGIFLRRNKKELQKLETAMIGLNEKQVTGIHESITWLWQHSDIVNRIVW